MFILIYYLSFYVIIIFLEIKLKLEPVKILYKYNLIILENIKYKSFFF